MVGATSTPIYQIYLPAASSPMANSPLRSLTSLPRYISAPILDNVSSMPGGGLTRRILTSIPERWTIGTGFLVWMGMEGDNRADAALMADALAKLFVADGRKKGQFQSSYLSLLWTERHTDWIEPRSWQQGLFGTPNDQALFG